MITESILLPNRYFDSVFLMRVAKRLAGAPGIAQAAAVMGTPKNVEVLARAGYEGVDRLGARPDDLLVTLQAGSPEEAREVLDSIEAWLQRDSAQAAGTVARTLDQALDLQPASNLAVISVPGAFAAREARQALERGLDVFLFSDNVALEDERQLKRLARQRGRLLMGPDCGTAIIAGAAIGFANAVRRGPIGVVGATGTGTQEVTTLVHRAGSGISHAIGVGSRDLSDAIGGISALAAIDALEADEETSVIVVLSKPPGKRTLRRIDDRVARCSKPVVTCFLGVAGERPAVRGNVAAAGNLDAAAAAALRFVGRSIDGGGDTTALAASQRSLLGSRQRFARGVFAGGTFCYQAQQVFQRSGLAVRSNEPLDKKMKLPDATVSAGHTMVDLGADEFTQGRPHPMIDSTARSQRILQEARDPGLAVLLLDFILGYGASPDPVGDLLPAIREAVAIAGRRGDRLPIVASICGTPGDPQGLDAQTRLLRDAGVMVLLSSYEAARLAAGILGADP